jgi:hypothetical protein
MIFPIIPQTKNHPFPSLFSPLILYRYCGKMIVMKKLLLLIGLVFFSFNLSSKEVFLKCGYVGEDFKPSKEFVKKYTSVKPKIKIGMSKILLSINVSKKKIKFISEGEKEYGREVPINFENDSVYMYSDNGDPNDWDKKFIVDGIDLSWLFMLPKEDYDLSDLQGFIDFGVKFDSFEELRSYHYISINKFNLDLKVYHHLDGLLDNSEKTGMMIGGHYYKYSCNKIEEQL